MIGLPFDVELAAPYALFLGLAALPLLLLAWRPRREGVAVATGSALMPLRPTWRVRLLKWLPALRIAAVVLLAIAAAGPRVGDANAIVPAEGIDMALSVDTSTSMTTSSLGDQNRLEVTKDVIREFIAGLENDRVGLVAFAETGLALSPPTLDYDALDQIIASLDSGFLPDGTAIGLGLAEALNMLRDSTAASRAVVLLTDGQHNEQSISPQEAAGLAEALNVKIYTIGIISPGSAGGSFGVDEELLEAISEQTGGRYFAADSPEALAEIYEEIGQLEKSGVGRERFERFTELVAWFVLPAALLLALDLVLRATWLRRHPA